MDPKSVVKLFPSENKILLDDGLLLEYEILIVATGIQINWDSIKGLKSLLALMGYVAIILIHMLILLGEN